MAAEKAHTARRLSIAYITNVASAALRSYPIDLLDLLLVTCIANFNTLPPEEGSRRTSGPYGISRNAVSRSLNIPLETVRRRVSSLIERGLLAEQSDGLVFRADNDLGLGNNAALNALNLELLRELFRGLKAAGIDLD